MVTVMAIRISDYSKKAICRSLKVNHLSELLDQSFSQESIETPEDCEMTRLYADRNRGSVRITTGRFYSTAEYQDHIAKVKGLRIP